MTTDTKLRNTFQAVSKNEHNTEMLLETIADKKDAIFNKESFFSAATQLQSLTPVKQRTLKYTDPNL